MSYTTWARSGNMSVVGNPTTLDELNKEYENFNSMPLKLRMRADDESIRLYGKTNKERYDEMNAKFLKKDLTPDEEEEIDNLVQDNSSMKTIEESNWLKSAKVYKNKLFFISEKNMNNATLYPRVPSNFLTKNGYEDDTTPRVCMSKSIDGALRGLSSNLKGKDLYIHEPISYDVLNLYKPTLKEVPDSNLTKEVWILNKVKIKFIQKIRIEEAINKPLKYNYGNNTAELYDWNYEVLSEDAQPIEEPKVKMDHVYDRIRKWRAESNMMLMYPDYPLNKYGKVEELNDWNAFSEMPLQNRRRSDWASLEINGMTNKDIHDKYVEKLAKVDFDENNNIKILPQVECIFNYIKETNDIELLSENFHRLKSRNTYEDSLISILEGMIHYKQFTEATKDNELLKPIFIVLVEGNSLFSHAIKGVTSGEYSHAAIGFDEKLKELYSFNVVNDKKNSGFSIEKITKYNKNGKLGIYAIFVKEYEYDTIKYSIEEYIRNRSKSKYSFLNAALLPLNLPFEFNNFSLICSQFVDKILKLANIDITGKRSSLVNPNDFHKIAKVNDKIYTLFSGKVNNYRNGIIRSKLEKLYNDARYINESMIIFEAKEFPIEFDKDGNLFIRNIKPTSYYDEYNNSHKLLLQYHKSNNIEGMKYEIAKLWYMNIKLEALIKKSVGSTKHDYIDTRALILNDFTKYITVIMEEDKDFNFTEYYSMTPFNEDTIRVSRNTLKYTTDFLKTLNGNIL